MNKAELYVATWLNLKNKYQTKNLKAQIYLQYETIYRKLKSM